MIDLFTPKNSVIDKARGKSYVFETRKVEIYRYNPDYISNPYIDIFEVNTNNCGTMVLDILDKIKKDYDPKLVYRKSCREGICGSCSMNINGENTLACLKKIKDIKGTIKIYPLPHLPVLKDLACDLTHLFDQYKSIKPWITPKKKNKTNGLTGEYLQSPKERLKIDGLWECILCFCCTTSCPSYWWNGKNYLGPATILQINRWTQDSRDGSKKERIMELDDDFKVNRCHNIFNCTTTCPKGLNPAKAIGNIKENI